MYGAEKDMEMMSSPIEWPYWPRLPVKRSDPKWEGQIEVGVMMAVEGHLTTVFLQSMYSTIDMKDESKKIVYADVKAIQADGWVVD
jgi:hypothetical protein